ncbi:MAG TPA: hypothetical protein VI168_09980 [Croceibacterium sp.]
MGMGKAGGCRRFGSTLIAMAGSVLVAGCAAPLVAGLAAGAGVLGVGAGTEALSKREMADDDRLRHISAASLGISSTDLATISGKDWRGDILYWVATDVDGRRFRCEYGAGTAHCVPGDAAGPLSAPGRLQ